MIYLNNDISTFYIPKSSENSGGDNIRFINSYTKVVLDDISVCKKDLYYKLSDERLNVLEDGQYKYEIYTDNIIYDGGIAQKGNYITTDTSVYNQNINYIQYEG